VGAQCEVNSRHKTELRVISTAILFAAIFNYLLLPPPPLLLHVRRATKAAHKLFL